MEALPEIRAAVVVAAPERAFPQPRERVALRVYTALAPCGVRCVEEVAFLGGEEEEQAVDEPKQLLKIVLRRQVASVQHSSQLVVGWMLEEPVSETAQRAGNAVA